MNTKLLSRFPNALLIPITILLIILNSQTAHATGVCYVKANASGANNGASWADAYTDLQSALGASPCTEIWVAAGTYKPISGTDRTVSFVLKNGVAIYGGFIGTESISTDRNPSVNVTTLSGDISVTGNTLDNSYHVVSSNGVDGTAVLDGFTVTRGYAHSAYPDDSGGGMFNLNSNPTLTNIIFNANSATVGGGMYNNNSNPILAKVIFNANSAYSWGGGMYNLGSSPTITDVTFSNNSAEALYSLGGGIYNNLSSNPTLTNITISGNHAWNGGGMFNENSNPTLTNVTISGNTADNYGGGVWIGFGNPILTNVTINGNSATYGGGMIIDTSNPQIRDSIFWGDTASSANAEIYTSGITNLVLADSVVAGGCPSSGATCTNILTINPILGPLSNNGGFTQTMVLGTGSSAIDTGNDATCASTDQRGVTRPQGPHCDMGAYEWVNYPNHIFMPLMSR